MSFAKPKPAFVEKYIDTSIKVEAKGLTYRYEDDTSVLSDSDFTAKGKISRQMERSRIA